MTAGEDILAPHESELSRLRSLAGKLLHVGGELEATRPAETRACGELLALGSEHTAATQEEDVVADRLEEQLRQLREVQLESEKQGTEELRLARDRLLADVASNKELRAQVAARQEAALQDAIAETEVAVRAKDGALLEVHRLSSALDASEVERALAAQAAEQLRKDRDRAVVASEDAVASRDAAQQATKDAEARVKEVLLAARRREAEASKAHTLAITEAINTRRELEEKLDGQAVQLRDLRFEKEAAEDQLAKSEQQAVTLRKEVDTLLAALATSQEESKRTRERAVDAETQLEESRLEATEAQRLAEEQGSKCDFLQQEVVEMQLSIDALKMAAETNAKEREASTSREADLRRLLEEADEGRKAAEEMVMEETISRESWEKQAQETEDQLEDEKQRVMALQVDVADLKEELKAVQDEVLAAKMQAEQEQARFATLEAAAKHQRHSDAKAADLKLQEIAALTKADMEAQWMKHLEDLVLHKPTGLRDVASQEAPILKEQAERRKQEEALAHMRTLEAEAAAAAARAREAEAAAALARAKEAETLAAEERAKAAVAKADAKEDDFQAALVQAAKDDAPKVAMLEAEESYIEAVHEAKEDAQMLAAELEAEEAEAIWNKIDREAAANAMSLADEEPWREEAAAPSRELLEHQETLKPLPGLKPAGRRFRITPTPNRYPCFLPLDSPSSSSTSRAPAAPPPREERQVQVEERRPLEAKRPVEEKQHVEEKPPEEQQHHHHRPASPVAIEAPQEAPKTPMTPVPSEGHSYAATLGAMIFQNLTRLPSPTHSNEVSSTKAVAEEAQEDTPPFVDSSDDESDEGAGEITTPTLHVSSPWDSVELHPPAEQHSQHVDEISVPTTGPQQETVPEDKTWETFEDSSDEDEPVAGVEAATSSAAPIAESWGTPDAFPDEASQAWGSTPGWPEVEAATSSTAPIAESWGAPTDAFPDEASQAWGSTPGWPEAEAATSSAAPIAESWGAPTDAFPDEASQGWGSTPSWPEAALDAHTEPREIELPNVSVSMPTEDVLASTVSDLSAAASAPQSAEVVADSSSSSGSDDSGNSTDSLEGIVASAPPPSAGDRDALAAPDEQWETFEDSSDDDAALVARRSAFASDEIQQDPGRERALDFSSEPMPSEEVLASAVSDLWATSGSQPTQAWLEGLNATVDEFANAPTEDVVASATADLWSTQEAPADAVPAAVSDLWPAPAESTDAAVAAAVTDLWSSPGDAPSWPEADSHVFDEHPSFLPAAVEPTTTGSEVPHDDAVVAAAVADLWAQPSTSTWPETTDLQPSPEMETWPSAFEAEPNVLAAAVTELWSSPATESWPPPSEVTQEPAPDILAAAVTDLWSNPSLSAWPPASEDVQYPPPDVLATAVTDLWSTPSTESWPMDHFAETSVRESSAAPEPADAVLASAVADLWAAPAAETWPEASVVNDVTNELWGSSSTEPLATWPDADAQDTPKEEVLHP